jgi:NAD+ kinase
MYANEFNKNVKKVLISYKKDARQAYEAAIYISELIDKRLIETVIRPSMDITAADLEYVGLAIVLGGDGTLLITFGKMYPVEVPIIGIDFGRLGFLVEISDDYKSCSIEKFFDGTLEFSRRMALDVEIIRNGEKISSFISLNEAVIAREKSIHARIIDLKTYINGIWLNDFNADGLIIATPTGSTGYSLSAGGPVVHTDLDAIIITPICPHTLTNRPVIVGTDEIALRIKVPQQEREIFISVDARDGIKLFDNDEIIIKKHPSKFFLAMSLDLNYWDILRMKLKW